MCMTLLLRQQPSIGDLRSISSALRMIADMERIGDPDSRYRRCIQASDRFSTGSAPEIFI